MERVIYCRVANKEQTDSFKAQQKAVQEQIDKTQRIKTVIWFAGGESRELTDAEIRMIFEAALRGEKYVTLDRPLIKHEFEGPFGRRTFYGLRRYNHPLLGTEKD